jgi:cyclin B
MPFMQPKLSNRSPAGNGALRSARGNCENTNAGANIRRNNKFNVNGATSSNNRAPVVNASVRAGALSDITNVATGRGPQTDKAKTVKSAYRSFQPPAVAPIVVPMEGSDTQSVQEYVQDIQDRLFSEESRFLPKSDYMDMQTDINTKMRMILIDWMIEVHMKYHLRAETLHLTINLIDRYLSRLPITRKRLQLVGVTSMFIASKFEEIHPPELHDWVYICDRAYTKEDILLMECAMLSTLSFQVVVPTAAHFFDFLEKANNGNCDAVHRTLAQYILELGLLDFRMLKHTPSHAVSAALLLSNQLLKVSPAWSGSMIRLSRHTEESLRECVEEFRGLLGADFARAGGQLQALHKKFSAKEHYGVAKMKF